MAINETITGDTASSTTVPTVSASDIIVEGNGTGTIRLQVKAPGGNWVNISQDTGAFSIQTADPTLTYRFLPQDVVGNVRVFMGP